MRRIFPASLALLLSACAATPPPQAVTAPPAAAPQAAPLTALVDQVHIPYDRFTLANGLTVLVNTDRKAPVVGVTLYYRVGSKHEPRGRTGFAHLYEHLFFGGSANVPNFDIPLEAAGSTATNGTTWYDRTNYVETVPTGALDLALFMEADRMANLLPAVTQDKLDKQRGVVQNEKRQGDNDPYGLMEYAVGDGLFPVGHPYRHSTIGSMADLDAATLEDVRQWFRDNYGPNNVVLVLSGDIDAATARPLVEKWFGHIPAGRPVPRVEAGPVTLPAPVRREMADQVPVARLTRHWSAPGVNDADTPALQIGMHILGGLKGSRLDNALVRGQQLAVSVSASALAFEQVSLASASMDVKPGVDRKLAEAAFDKVVADLLASGPTEDEVRRAVTSTLSAQIGALEEVGGLAGKGTTLAEGELYSGDPDKFRKDLARMAALTPAEIQAAMQRWLSRPVLAINIVPGERTERGETMGGWGDEASRPAPTPDPKKPAAPLAPAPKRAAPPVTAIAALSLPAVERARLSNGIPVTLTRRGAVPKVVVTLGFDAGLAADALDTPGTQATMLDMLDEGTLRKSATEIAEAQERLGAEIGIGSDIDSSSITLDALSANLAPSLALMAEIAREPAFAEAEVARVRDRRLAELAQSLAEPRALAGRELLKAMFGSHPYAQPRDGYGDAAALAALTPAALRAAHDKWLRPDLARITVTGDVAMAQLLPQLEAAFGGWTVPATPPPAKSLAAATPPARARIIVYDRPNSPQSVIYAGKVLPVNGRTQGLEPLDLANEVLGGGFLSRLNSDLREDKGWSYGVYSAVRQPVGPRYLSIAAPVQADRTGASIKAILAQIAAFPGKRPVNAEELQRVTEGAIRALPQQLQTNADVHATQLANQLLGRPDDYLATLAARYRAIDGATIGQAATRFLGPRDLTIVVVGERKLVEPQLKGIGLPVEYVAAIPTAP